MNELDHPCKNTCSGWKQGFERGKEILTEQLKVCEAERDKANEACRVLEELTGANNQRNRWLGVAAATALLVSERDQLLEQVKVLREALEKVKGEK